MFAFRVHAHSHGDVNTAYRVRHNEWQKIAQGDPQWPQAFYPSEEIYEIRDGDALIGICTYHNDENRKVYAGSTHNDEMCNIYLMYYTENTEGVQDTCSGSTYPQLETIIPAEALVKPQPPSNFHQLDESIDQFLSHHDMKGSKTHHELEDRKQNQKNSPNSLSPYFLPNIEDYYDYVEQGRSKNRLFNQADLRDNSYLDSNPLLDVLSQDTESEYQFDPALLLQLAKLNKLNSNSGPNFRLNEKLKDNLNNFNLLASKTISSKKKKL